MPAMTKNSLLISNPYLKDPATRDALLRQSVISSSAIEGVGAAAAKALGLTKKNAGLPCEGTPTSEKE